jgi:hypothetical protein
VNSKVTFKSIVSRKVNSGAEKCEQFKGPVDYVSHANAVAVPALC